jgi:AAA+ superfamily predicted ATPase
MSSRRRAKISAIGHELYPLVKLWILRMLISLSSYRQFVKEDGFANDALAEVLGLEAWINGENPDFDKREVQLALRTMHRQMEVQSSTLQSPAILNSNIDNLAKLIGLSEAECQILAFTVTIHNDRFLDDASDWLGSLSSPKVVQILAVVLSLPEHEVRDALAPSSLLTRAGLVSLSRVGIFSLRNKLDLLSDKFADIIQSSATDPVTLLRDTVVPSKKSQLTLEDFTHITEPLKILIPYLEHAISSRKNGVNIFIYGKPGTGKSELVRVLAQHLARELFEVTSEDEDGDPIKGERRLRAYRAAQSVLTQRQAFILFDEVEDVFNDGDEFMGMKSTAQTRKAWVNRMLEENTIPTIWLSNSIRCLDNAFIRRFDMVFELSIPPKRQRIEIVRAACSSMLSEQAITRIAEMDTLTPAIITRAASIISSIQEKLPEQALASSVEYLVSNTLIAQGFPSVRNKNNSPLPEFYHPQFINANVDLMAIAEGIAKSQSCRMCFYGPPGTGKTAYGYWLADYLGKPLVIKRASDLLSKWVGDNEKNIAAAFREAEQDNAILLIDEVDSFLQDRRHAQRSWELSGVNEMLTQMESYQGIFIASTNLMSSLDSAALRRFDLKVSFDYLNGEQAWQLLQSYGQSLSLGHLDSQLKGHIHNLLLLTPGDFAAVARQHRFRPLTSYADMLDALTGECALKDGHKRTIGFV